MIKKGLVLLLCVLCMHAGFSQRFFLHAEAGMMNYGGDLQDRSFTFNQGNTSFGLGAGYRISDHLSALFSYTSGKIAASDAKTNQDNARRNLSFYSKISETSLLFQASLYNIPGDRKLTPYIFGGVALFHFDPYAYTFQGEQVYLQPLHTEGQGLPQYPGRTAYKLNEVALPFGFGLNYAINEKIMIGGEVSFRKLFTDYLDDASSLYYADTAILRSSYGDLSAKMSFRSDETSNPLAFNTDKIQRANPDKKDSYYTAMIRVSFFLGEIFKGGGSDGSFSKSVKKQTGCPVKVL